MTQLTPFHQRIQEQDWYTAAQLLRGLIKTDLDNLETWLSNGDVRHIMAHSPEELAVEYDEWSRGGEG